MEYSKTTVQDRPSAPDVTRSELGRYRLLRELGEGGMGVVWEAFDPDLERKLAIKLLRAGGGDAEQRLLREARAMAKLAHPNVVTVYEVGTVDGTDYVAMELVDGESLVDWLRGGKRSTTEILDAFRDAGRGLAAAHAAGIVHRDFKPHNVLRSTSGRIAVTDFGLARSSGPVAADAGRELTATGAVVGTPAYMAPEQWNGDPVTPATDQFAFCVALWEAFAGARPYRGATVDELRARMIDGPDALDASPIPRRLRSVLRRGLDLEPERRWPNMHALLAHLVPRRWPIVAAGTVLVVGGAALAFAMRSGPVEDVCPPPARDVDLVWPVASPALFAASGKADAGRALDDVAHRYAVGRAHACELPAKRRDAALACYDAVIDRFAAVVYTAQDLHGDITASAWLLEPALCEADPPPRLARTRPEAAALLGALWRGAIAVPANASAAFGARTSADPCVRTMAHISVADAMIQVPETAERELLEAQQDVERCDDDDLRANIALLFAAIGVVRDLGGPAVELKFKVAQDAVQRAPNPTRVLSLHRLHALTAELDGSYDDLVADAEAMIAAASAPDQAAFRMLTEYQLLVLRGTRSSPDDIRAVGPGLASLRPRAVARFGEQHELVKAIDEAAIDWQLDQDGDIARAHAALDKLRVPGSHTLGRTIHGRVVDGHGAPVAGAMVAADTKIRGDSIAVVGGRSPGLRIVTTDRDGKFEMRDAALRGLVIAQLADRRSPAVPIDNDVVLALAPTAHIDGRIATHGVAWPRFEIKVKNRDHKDRSDEGVIGVMRPDGTFAIDGAPRGRVNVEAMVRDGLRMRVSTRAIDIDQPAASVALELPHTARTLHVIARNTMNVAHPHSVAIIMTGTYHEFEGAALEGMAGEIVAAVAFDGDPARLPADVAKRLDSMSTIATFGIVPEGPISACAVALPARLTDFMSDRLYEILDKTKLHCTPIKPNDTTVVVDVAPLPRID